MAKVNGEPILETQFYKQYQMIANQLMNRGMSRDQMKAEHIGRQVLQEMIAQTLVRQEAERLGLLITPVELRQNIERNPLFQNNQGKLDKDSYQRGLNALRVSAQDFEAQMRNDLIMNKMLNLVSSTVWTDPTQSKDRYDFLFEKRDFDYIFLPTKDALNKVSVSEEEMKTYYEAHKNEFSIPKKADLSFIRLTPLALVDPKSISEAEISAWYDGHKNDYTQREAVRCAHILVPLKENASAEEKTKAAEKIKEIQRQLQEGKSFADLANAYNSSRASDKNGELGWIQRGETVEPFEKAAFSQAIGKVSDEAIATQFGLHLILVHEKRPESLRALSEVKDEIAQKIALERGQDKMVETGESLLEDTLLGKDLAKTAEKHGLKPEKSGLLSAEEMKTKLGLQAEDATNILSGLPVDTLLQAGDAILVVKVDTIEKESIQPFEACTKEISQKLLFQKAGEYTMNQAREMRKSLEDGNISKSIQEKFSIERTKPVDRMEAIEPFKQNAAFSKACFEAKKETWLANPFTLTRNDGTEGVVLFYVHDIFAADKENWERIHTIMESGLAREHSQGMKNIFLNDLFNKANITNLQMDRADKFDI